MDLGKLAFIMSLINKGNGTNGENVNLSDYYTKLQTDARIAERIAEIVANAPEDFDTLKELSDWIASHEDSAAAMNSAIAQKADKSTTYTKTEVNTALDNKVNKVAGKQLSTNDFTNAYKSKIDDFENYDDTEIKADIAESESQAAINKSTLGYQAKNLLKNTANSRTQNGITFTVNDDRSVKVDGTATANTFCIINLKFVVGDKPMVLTGCPAGGGESTYRMDILNGTDESPVVVTDIGSGKLFDRSKVTTGTGVVRIRISNGSVLNNVIFKPMIRLAEITDDTYEPYKPSVEERLAALEDITVISTSLVNTLKYPFNNSEKQ